MGLASTGKTRILYVCHDGDLFGSQQSLAQIIEHLPDGDEAVLSLAKPGPLEERLAGKAEVVEHKRVSWFKHSPRHVLQRLGDVLSLLVNAWPRANKLAQMIRAKQIDMVHTNSVVSLEGALAAKLAGVPHIWHVRELFAENNPKLNAILGSWLTARLIAVLSEEIVCISQAVARPFLPWASDSVSVIYNAVPDLYCNPPHKPECSTRNEPNALPYVDTPPKAVGFVGRITPNKRLQDVVEALAILKQRGESVVPTVHVFGVFVDAEFEAWMHQLIADAGLEQQVVFHGFQTDAQRIYEAFDVLICPSLNEAFGRVVIEAMSAGKLCIGTDSGGIPEIIRDGETGFLVPPCDPHVLATVLNRAITLSHADFQNMVQSAQLDVYARFGMAAQITALCAVYDRCGVSSARKKGL